MEAGLPLPLTKQMVNGFEVDFYWPDLGLVVETDGKRLASPSDIDHT
jgi:very-short-patch-repair endonuclease